MKKVLISSFDMEVGGVERSLVSLLDNFDYSSYKVELMLYKHQGEFMSFLTDKVTLLNEVSEYTTFRQSIKEIIKSGNVAIGCSRVIAKAVSDILGRVKRVSEPGYYQMQLMWKLTMPFLPTLKEEYDVAISYLWPHYFVAEKVKAKKKIAWIHTDYSIVNTLEEMDIKMWDKFDYIVAVSEACKGAFLQKYPVLKNKVVVIENISSPEFITKMSQEQVENPMKYDKRFKLITVARLSHAKGIDQAILAMKKLKEKGLNNLAWYVVGYGGDEDKLKELIRENSLDDCFFLLGKKINPYPYIKEGNLYVQPSRYEGKAVTVTEAMILHKPILITNYSTALSQLSPGAEGYICDLNIDGLANSIEQIYTNPSKLQKVINLLSHKEFENKKEFEKLQSIMDDGIIKEDLRRKANKKEVG